MALIPCESCRRHVRATDDACPFCKTVRAGTTVVAVASTMLAVAGCDVFSGGAKYGGPPPGLETVAQNDAAPTVAQNDAAPTVAQNDAAPPPEAGPADAARPRDVPDASPRLKKDVGPLGDLTAVPAYGGAPRH